MVYITGDIHGDYARFHSPKLKKLRKNDTLIVCGDFGFIWDGSKKESKTLKKIGKLRYNVAFVDGCHENFDLLEKHETVSWNGGTAHAISGNLVHLMRGEIYNIDGYKIFTFGGGSSPDIDIKREAHNWWERELPSYEEIKSGADNLAQNDYSVDYIVTHEPPSTLKNCIGIDLIETSEMHTFFDRINKDCKFKRWFFGRCHINKVIPPKFHGVFDNVIKLD